MEYFKLETGTNLVHIPYKGTGPALTDLAGGSTQAMISALPGTIPFIQGKRLVALATTGAKRSALLPELPTLSESGVPGYVFDTWYGIHAPVKISRDIVVKLNKSIAGALEYARREGVALQGRHRSRGRNAGGFREARQRRNSEDGENHQGLGSEARNLRSAAFAKPSR